MNEKTNNSPENFRVTGDWVVQSKTLKAKFNLLTDSDLLLEAGKDNEMLNRVQQRLRKSREEVISIIKNSGEKPATRRREPLRIN